MNNRTYKFLLIFLIAIFSLSCNKDKEVEQPVVNYNPNISDDYSSISALSNSGMWGPYNLHDPSIIKVDSFYYIFSTDVAYGPNLRCGIMKRRSADLVQWKFLGWVFDSIPDKPLHFMEAIQTGYKQLGLWAPFIIKVGDQFRLYYSVPGNNGVHLACIALVTSNSIDGPWNDEGIVISCTNSDTYNAIDPSVIIDQENGKHWMSYGSYEEGIFIVELDPATGRRLVSNDLGKRIAYRFKRHDAIEGSEILYNTELKKYFLFVSYDWLEDNYNVRVGRSDKPEGPYFDFFGNDMAAIGDDFPIITARYGFRGHSGWQGFGHCGLLKDGDNYYYVSQARLSSNKYLMDLHIHRMVWTSEGWPVISPERYVNVPQLKITSDSIPGSWEHIDLNYNTANNLSKIFEFKQDGVIEGIDNSTWSLESNELLLHLNGGETIIKAKVFYDWDWENKKVTICYSGLSQEGRSGWGKKISSN
jgi:arabinan endo-1,5-alpha-L-arabinosidase